MRRVIAIAVAGASLAGCSSFSLDSFKSAPPTVQVQLESVPPGADATTSLGPGCKTPCSIACPRPTPASPSPSRCHKFQPVTVPVQVIRNPGDFATPADDHHRSQPGGRGTQAGRAAAEGAQADAAEEAEAAQGGRGAGAARLPAAARRALIACAAPTAPQRCGL